VLIEDRNHLNIKHIILKADMLLLNERGYFERVPFAISIAVYQNVIIFQNLSTFEQLEKRVDLIYFSGLIRRLLSRESGLIRKLTKWFGYLADPGSWTYWVCTRGLRRAHQPRFQAPQRGMRTR
jgi:hypothetical protein